jgi:hypothetical protein
MPQYSKTTWVDGSAPAISAANLNKLEQGVFDSLRQDGSTTMSAQLVTIAGTAATPAIAPTGDSNTGIFFPAADTIAFGEGGTEVMRINSSGNVGIGTDSPSGKLEINTQSSGINLASIHSPDISQRDIALINGTKATVFSGSVTPSGGETNGIYNILGCYDGVEISTDAFHILVSNTSNSKPSIFDPSSFKSVLYANGAGNVGIGTAFPVGRLSIQGAAGTSGINQGIGLLYSNGTQFGAFGLNDSSGWPQLMARASAGLTFHVNSDLATTGEAMRITSAGKVGIGTTSPVTTLQIGAGNTSADSSIVKINTANGDVHGLNISNFTGSTGTYGPRINFDNSGHGEWSIGTGNNENSFKITSAGNEKLRIDSAGNVGIGTQSPQALLHIGGSALNTNNAYFTNGNSDASFRLGFANGSGSTTNSEQGALVFSYNATRKGAIGFERSSSDSCNAVTFFVGANSEAMRINSAGYLLIGYLSSNGAYPLQVNGQIFATSSTIATSDGRYKKDIVSLDGALDIVAALNPVQFNWKEHPVHKFNTEVPTIGFIAQEVAEVLKDKAYLTSVIKKSECTWETETGETVEREVTRDVKKQVEREVIEEVDGEQIARTITETVIEQVTETITEAVKETHTEEFFGIAESNMIAILTKAIQELNAKVEALEAQLAK